MWQGRLSAVCPLTPKQRQIIGPELGSFWQKNSVAMAQLLEFLAALRRLVSAQRSYRSSDANRRRAFALTGRPSIGSVVFHCWARIARICTSSSWAQAKCCAAILLLFACWHAPVNAPQMAMIFSTTNEFGLLGRNRPCRQSIAAGFLLSSRYFLVRYCVWRGDGWPRSPFVNAPTPVSAP